MDFFQGPEAILVCYNTASNQQQVTFSLQYALTQNTYKH